MRNTFVNSITNHFSERNDLFLITGDSGFMVLDDLQKKYQDRYLNLGIAEQNMIGFASGLALGGRKVFVYSIIPFLIYRCYEQIRNDICYQNLPVVLVGTGGGISYAPQGMTHYAVEDLGVTKTLPNLEVISPCDPVETVAATKYALTCNNPVYIRLAKKDEPIIHKNEVFDICKPQIVNNGKGVALVFHGSISIEVVKAKDKLKTQGIDPLLISVPMVQPLDKQTLITLLKDVSLVVCIEEHYEHCGLSSTIKDMYVNYLPNWKLLTMGIPNKFIHTIKNTESMRSHFGIASEDIYNMVVNNVQF